MVYVKMCLPLKPTSLLSPFIKVVGMSFSTLKRVLCQRTERPLSEVEAITPKVTWKTTLQVINTLRHKEAIPGDTYCSADNSQIMTIVTLISKKGKAISLKYKLWVHCRVSLCCCRRESCTWSNQWQDEKKNQWKGWAKMCLPHA